MDEVISASDANRKFSRLLRAVREGHSYLVTAHGTPVAKIVPVVEDALAAGAKEALISRLRAEPVVEIGRWTRDELYEDEH